MRGPTAVLLIAFLGAWLPPFALADEVPRLPLIGVRSLTPEEANLKTEIRTSGTVTFVDRKSLSVFFQDDTAGAYFRPAEVESLRPGDVVDVVGRTQRGYFVPGLAKARFEILRRGGLPPAVEARFSDLVSARFHYQWVAITGLARAHSSLKDGRSLLRLAMDGHTVEIRCESGLPPENVPIGSLVRVEGLVSGTINARRQLVMPYVRVADWSTVRVLEPAAAEADLRRISAADLLKFRNTGFSTGRVRVSGIVTACFSDGLVFARDDTTGLALHFVDKTELVSGDRVEVLGFPQADHLSVRIADAVLVERRADTAATPVPLSVERLMGGEYDFDLVGIEGRVTDTYRIDAIPMLTLQNEGRVVRVRLPGFVAMPPEGSWVRVTGICQVDTTREQGYLKLPELVTLRARTADDLVILHAPPWWTAQRLLYASATLAVLVGLAGLWIAILRRQIAAKTAALASKIESEATLHERHRIARDFHDTLEQDLAGLRFQLDAIAVDTLDRTRLGLVLASQNLVRRIQLETRALISDLRLSSGPGTDLVSALRDCLTLPGLRAQADVQLRLDAVPPDLPAATVRHLRLIVGEGVANAIKHSGCRRILVAIAAAERRILITVTDDGSGFDPAAHTHGSLGHFGCIGIRERCRKIGASPDWSSEQGRGTRLSIALPLPPGTAQHDLHSAPSTAATPPP